MYARRSSPAQVPHVHDRDPTFLSQSAALTTARSFARSSEPGRTKVGHVCSMPRRRREDFVCAPGEEVPRDVTRVVVPGSVAVLPDEAFCDNHSLEEVVLDEGVVEVGEWAFYKCVSLWRVHLPSTILRIGDDAFSGCTSLRELNLPEGITEIGPAAFVHLSSLERVCLPSTLSVIRRGTFSNCTSLREVIFPDEIRSIREFAFEGCKSLESIVLPSTLNVIGDAAFCACQSLRTVKLRGGIQMILSDAFDECNLLNCIRVPCKVLVIAWNSDGQHVVCATDEIASDMSDQALVIASECSNSIRPGEVSDIEIAIIRILGEEIIRRRRHRWLEASQHDELVEKYQQLRMLMAPYEMRHKKEIASFLEQRGVEMVQENVLSFLHFLS